ncbi:MAG: hypothetical protein N4J56_000749 [Chroococcidiopsis sp. SAG 2025]|nr:hypothetical protein [Chroococcidiopsis sp. SAG 2025]
MFRLLITYNYLTFVRAGLAPRFTANASNFWSKPAPTVRAGLAKRFTTTARNLGQNPL